MTGLNEAEVGGGTERGQRASALEQARRAAYPPAEYVGQESFITASQVLRVARAAGARPGARVLDACCGNGGPALLVARTTGCRVMGVDIALDAIRLADAARRRQGAAVDFLVADANHLPFAGNFDVVLLFETMLEIEDKAALLAETRRLLRPGGCLGLTLEAGAPLSPEERPRLPESERVWLTPEADLLALLERSGFRPRWRDNLTAEHAAMARRLLDAFARERTAIAAELGEDHYQQLQTAHRQWAAWLDAGRVRKPALVAERLG